MSIEENLSKVGLSKSEIKVYLALLKIGRTSLKRLYEETSIERRNIYDLLNKLMKRGLATYSLEKGKKTFRTTSPDRIVNYLEEKEKEIINTKAAIKKDLGSLKKIHKIKKPGADAQIYRGKEGFKAIAEDMLNYPEVWVIGGNGGIEKHLPNYWIHYNNKRKKRGIMWHDLILEGSLMKIFKEKNKSELKKNELYEYRILPKELKSPSIINVYGNKVVTMLWDEDLFAVSIESKAIADSYKSYFKLLWGKCD